MALLRYDFEGHFSDAVSWVPGPSNVADVLTKPDSPLIPLLGAFLASGYVPPALLDVIKT